MITINKNIPLKIRKSKKSDFAKVFEIWLQNQPQVQEVKTKEVKKLKEEMNRLFKSKRSIFSVAEMNKQIIGWQALVPLISNPLVAKYTAQISTYIDHLHSVPNLGKKLTENTLDVARNAGIEHIYGWVNLDNRAANLLGRQFGNHKFIIPGSGKKSLPNFNLYVIDVD